MNRAFDLIVFGATGFTGRLVAQYLLEAYGVGGAVTWAMAGRNPDKLAATRRDIGAPQALPLLQGDASDAAALAARSPARWRPSKRRAGIRLWRAPWPTRSR